MIISYPLPGWLVKRKAHRGKGTPNEERFQTIFSLYYPKDIKGFVFAELYSSDLKFGAGTDSLEVSQYFSEDYSRRS
jgi:hypothetical protein